MQERPLLIRADRVFDGTARPPLEGGFVLLREGRVAAIGARGDGMPTRNDVETYEFPGCTVMPGLIDSHVHLSFSAGAAPLRTPDVSDLPPAHIHYAEYDPLADDGPAYAERLRAAGNEVELRCAERMIHGFMRARFSGPDAAAEFDRPCGFIRRVLGL